MGLHRKIVAAAALLGMLIGGSGQAALVIDVQDLLLPSGGSGSVDVLIRSDSTDVVNLAGYRFAISQVSGSGVLEFLPSFTSAASERQSNSEQGASAPGQTYIFQGDTDEANFVANRQDPNRQQLVGGDSTRSADNVTLNGENLLLARLEVRHISPVPTSARYEVALVEDPSNTFFFDSGFNRASIDSASFTNVGTVTVTAIPEPSSAICLATFVVIGISATRRRRARASK